MCQTNASNLRRSAFLRFSASFCLCSLLPRLGLSAENKDLGKCPPMVLGSRCPCAPVCPLLLHLWSVVWQRQGDCTKVAFFWPSVCAWKTLPGVAELLIRLLN